MAAEISRPDRVARYNMTAMTLHWVVAALIIINIVAGLAGANDDDKVAARRFVDFHKSVGLTLLGLIVLRILWRLAHKPPPLPRSYPKRERVAAHGVHYLLYAAMLLLPITGYIHDSAWKEAATHPLTLFGIPFPRLGPIQALDHTTRDHVHDFFYGVHVYLGYLLYGLLALHLLGVAKHHAFDREAELQRMLPGPGDPARPNK